MGGGTTIVEAFASGRKAVGCDLNSLAVFVADVKTTVLTDDEAEALRAWALHTIPSLSYHHAVEHPELIFDQRRTRNLHIPRARPIKKYLALALESSHRLPTLKAQRFARCALLNVSQWALNGRKQNVTLTEFRSHLAVKTIQMLEASAELASHVAKLDRRHFSPVLTHGSSEDLPSTNYFSNVALVDLVVTSPPYPGVHVLYHRWQVDGRRETPAPYWIADCVDGQGGAYYNFGERRRKSHHDYFDVSLRTLRGIHAVMREGALIVQMLAFSNPNIQLRRYLQNMMAAGFREVRLGTQQQRRIWRDVPRRAWHAQLNDSVNASREVLLIHTKVS